MVYTSPFLAVTGPAPRPTVAEGNRSGAHENGFRAAHAAAVFAGSVPEQPRCGLPCDWV